MEKVLITNVVSVCMLLIYTVSATSPFPAPDLAKCVYPTGLPHNATINSTCCPPYDPATPITDFEFPSSDLPLRVRMAAHLVDQDYIEKYNKAVQLMKNLPANDPRSFIQQSKIHCAYCSGSYFTNSTEIQVHYSWFFLPFHRWYLYFYERILGKLIGDDSFALPFWNWDSEAGMSIPPMYIDPNSPLFDPLRDACHQPPHIINLKHFNVCVEGSVNENYADIYTHIVSGAPSASLFYGGDYRYGSGVKVNRSRAGTIETSPHDKVHSWTGSSTQFNRENMGSLYSAARDPIFYSHHSNVDRMWTIWQDKLNRSDYQDTDLVDSKLLFYDENSRLVQVRVGDCYNTTKLGYKYQEVDIPWLTNGRSIKKAGLLKAKPVDYNPRGNTNQSPVSVVVKRNKIIKQQKEKEKEKEKEKVKVEEILVIDGIEGLICTWAKALEAGNTSPKYHHSR
ncbi:hypothetical protein SUGI_1175450 [Cryptomeria japonica]|nr:hypothetical protein SUGI_1175450 [Cryptomeria japonica]